MLKIGDFSKLSRISIRMLRHYDEIGLLMPDNTDPFTGYRYYSEAQLPLANRINILRDMGFGLADTKTLLSCWDDPALLESSLLLKKHQMEEESKELHRHLLLLENTIERIRKDEQTMKYDVTLKELPKRYVASLRKVIPSYTAEGSLWQLLREETAHLNLRDASPCYTLAIFHDKEFKERDVDIEIQTAVLGSYPDTEHVTFKTVEPIQMASATYKGSYDHITEANIAVAKWIKDNGYEFNGLSFCIYYVNPHDTSNPEEFVTEVCYPVKKK